MEYRLGTCSSCKAQFRVPATFKADKAKCKKCGGVVELGPVQGAAPAAAAGTGPAPGNRPAPAPAPAARPAPARPPTRPQPKPAAAAGSGSSPAQSASARASAPKSPASKPAAPRAPSARSKPGPSPARPAAPPAGKESVRAAAEAAAERVRAGRPTPAAAAPRAAPSAGAGRPGRAHQRPAKKKSKAPVLIGLGALLVVAAGAGWFLLGRSGSTEAQAAETETLALAPAPEEAATAAPGDLSPEDAPGVPEPAADAGSDESPGVETEEPAAPEPEPTDLSGLAPYGRLPETSAEDWDIYQQLTATYVDPTAGAAGNRARSRLVSSGYQAMPAVLNELLKVDLSTDEGYQNGDLLQKLLMEMCRGNNFGWKYSSSAKDQEFNRKVVEKWYRSWGQVVDNRRAWILLGKLTEEEGVEFLAQAEAAQDKISEPVGASETLEDF